MTRTERLLSEIPDAHKVWPLWFCPQCDVCGGECDDAKKEDGTPVPYCLKCKRDVEKPVYVFDPLDEGDDVMTMHERDLLDERNLHLMVRVARHLFAFFDLSIKRNGNSCVFDYSIISGAEEDSPSLALMRVCERALGLAPWEEHVEEERARRGMDGGCA